MAFRCRADPDGPGGELVTLLSVDDEPRRFPDELGGRTLEDVHGGTPDEALLLPPHSWRVLAP
jgi:hypothetical protein